MDWSGTRIESAGLTIYIPRVRGIESEGWHELRELVTHAEGRRLRLSVDDFDPYRGIRPISAPSRSSAHQMDHWKNLMIEAWGMLVGTDADEAAALAAAVTTIAPLPDLPESDFISASSAEAFGGIMLASPIDGTKFAEALIHEFQHMKLSGLLNLVELYDENKDKLFYAPWRDDPRPLSGLFQGVYAFLGVTNFWRQQTIFIEGAGARRAQFEFAYWRLQTWDTLAILQSRSELTNWGNMFAEEMTNRMRPWLKESVPAEVEQLALDAAIDHRASWRLLHVQAPSEIVRRLADARINGRDCPPFERSDSVLHPTTFPQRLSVRTAVTRLMLSSPAEFRRLSRSPEELSQKIPGATTADCVYLSGDYADAKQMYLEQLEADPELPTAWIGLGLATRRVRPTRASRGLLLYPELIRSTYNIMRRLGGGVVQPDSLAYWIGAPERYDIPPIYVAGTN